jgi:hypothetical protein
VALAGFSGLALAQDSQLDPASSIKFDLPDGSPVAIQSFDLGESRATARGGALVLDLHVALKLRNTSGKTIRGVTLLLLAQETPGGKMSVAVPSLNVGPNENFPMRINGRLLRPLHSGAGPLVHVSLDGVLFEGYGFFGPDRLNSRRQMVAWEMAAERDRRYFKQVLQSRGPEGLATEMRQSLNRQAERPRVDVQLARGRSTSSAGSASDRPAQFAFLEMPDSPVRPVDGSAEVSGNEARMPAIQVRNTSSRQVRYVEFGWLVKDGQGREFLAGSVPAPDGSFYLAPGKTGTVSPETSLRFSRNGGQPVAIRSMTAFVNEVQYSDGNVWIPKRESLQLDHSRLLNVLPPSLEEQRLTGLFLKTGISGVVKELNRF